MFYSPLRYPGGKNRLSAFIAKICVDNNVNGHYVEPYSGGASVALFLLIEKFVSKITINDKDRSIYAFWYSVLNKTDELCRLIEDAELSVKEWKRQKKIQTRKENTDLLELGFSTFYLNRTNRSGIINAGVIGGLNQTGNYLMDCRFNKKTLIKRIRKIAEYKKSIRLYGEDALKLIDRIQKEAEDNNIIFYFDPPYFLKGNTLYMNYYEHRNHAEISKKIKSIKNIKWIISYDNVPEIKKLYEEYPSKEFSIKHTAYKAKEGKEILFFSKGLNTPKIANYNPSLFKLRPINNSINIIYKEI